MEILLLTDIVIILGLSVAVLLIFHFIRLPAVVGLPHKNRSAGPPFLLFTEIKSISWKSI